MSKRKNVMPEGRREQAMGAAGHRCQGRRYGLEHVCSGWLIVHHKKPRGMGGTSDPSIHDLSNLAVLCDVAHYTVHANPAQAYEVGLLIRR